MKIIPLLFLLFICSSCSILYLNKEKTKTIDSISASKRINNTNINSNAIFDEMR